MATRIIIRRLEKPPEKELKEDIEWICESFGFYETIDREKTAYAIFQKLLESMADGKTGLSSTQLGEEIKITRGAALNHLKKMMATGLVKKDDGTYCMRCSSLYNTVVELRRDMNRMFEDIEEIAKEVDERMGVKVRRP
jgi:predicted transcriptional regulator